MTSDNSICPDGRRSALMTVSALTLCMAAAVLLPGCRKNNPERDQPGDTVEDAAVISLDTTFAGLLPEEFEINVPRDIPTQDINEWGGVMLSEMLDQEVDEAELSKSLSEFLPEDAVERVLRPQYVLSDATHLRDSLWARGLMQSVISESKTDTDQIVDLFYFVVNTVRLVPDEQTLPFGPFELAKYGQGTAEDRAWTFATLLRQQRIPAVVFVEKKSDEPADENSIDRNPQSLIAGALLNDSLYLFDVSLGLPIPGPDDDGTAVLIRKPATLKQVLDNPALLAKLTSDEDSADGITVDKLKQRQPQVIGDSSLWSRRMEGLQIGLPNEVKASIFDPLVSYGVYEGVIDQVSTQVKKVLPNSSVGVWSYPEQQRELRESVAENAQQAELLANLSQSFKVPRPMTVEAEQGRPVVDPSQLTLTFGPPWGTHLNGRVDQISGRPESAIPAYLKVQSWRLLPPSEKGAPQFAPALEPLIIQRLPPDVRLRHLLAAEEALLWRATCQIQKRDYESAATALEMYLRQLAPPSPAYPGRFRNEANYLAGVSLALSGNNRRGMAFLRNVDTKDGRYKAAQALIRRWSAQEENADR